jgi:hypothetical protein
VSAQAQSLPDVEKPNPLFVRFLLCRLAGNKIEKIRILVNLLKLSL